MSDSEHCPKCESHLRRLSRLVLECVHCRALVLDLDATDAHNQVLYISSEDAGSCTIGPCRDPAASLVYHPGLPFEIATAVCESHRRLILEEVPGAQLIEDVQPIEISARRGLA